MEEGGKSKKKKPKQNTHRIESKEKVGNKRARVAEARQRKQRIDVGQRTTAVVAALHYAAWICCWFVRRDVWLGDTGLSAPPH